MGNIQHICSVMYQQLTQYVNETECIDFMSVRPIFAILRYVCVRVYKELSQNSVNSYAYILLTRLDKWGYESYIKKSTFGSLQFLLIYRKAKAGELAEESGLSKLAMLTEINVEEVGVGGAKNFFEAKVIFMHLNVFCGM